MNVAHPLKHINRTKCRSRKTSRRFWSFWGGGYVYVCVNMFKPWHGVDLSLGEIMKTINKMGSDRNDPKAGWKKTMNLSNEHYLAEAESMPTTDELDKVGPGSHVRLGFESGYRFWCRVVEKRPTGFVGTVVDNLPKHPVKIGDQCYFDRSHVFRIMK